VELNNEFEVDRPIDETWVVLTDVERIAPCLPGAQLEEIEGDEYRGVVKIKVGPITAQYKGKATFVEKDEAARRAVLRAEGRDSRGQGNASALITAQLTENGSGGTNVTVNTDLTVTGKVAQFGRGVMAEVSEKLLRQFVTNLEARVLSEDGSGTPRAAAAPPAPAAPTAAAAPTASATPSPSVSPPPPPPPPPPAPAATPTSGPAPTAVAAPASDAAAATIAPGAPVASETAESPSAAASSSSNANGAPGVRKIVQDEPVAPVDLLEASGGAVAKRLAPLLGVIVVLWVLARLRRRHR
jgi:carbon monoxide dehydrogenase subunit G